MKSHFETEETKMEYLSHWRSTTLASVREQYPEKKIFKCFHLMVVKLQKIQRGLQGSYQINQSLRDQILNGCQGVQECKIALYNPAPTFEGVIAQIRNALFIEKQQPSTPNHFLSVSSTKSSSFDQNYIERKYKNVRGDEKSSPRDFKQGGEGYPSRSRNNEMRLNRQKKCYICSKIGCWSTTHSPNERKMAFSKF